MKGNRPVWVSVVTPAFNEAANLPVFYERMRAVMQTEAMDWEWVVVDDHSGDETWAVLQELAVREPRLRAVRLARNAGSHLALACGLERARGDCAVALAADLQDPPELVPALLEKWRQGAKVVWAVRSGREGISRFDQFFSRLYYWLMRHVAGMKEMPPTGADFFLADRLVLQVLRGFRERNTSLLALLTGLGFRQDSISYVKQARRAGTSGWTLAKKIKLVVDSLTSFSYLPIRLMSLVGSSVAVLGFVYALVIVFHALRGGLITGWSSLMCSVLILGGIQMLMMGVLGEYVWRALDEARNRPRYLIEDAIPMVGETATEEKT